MVSKQDLKRITDYLYEIPRSFRADMRVPARIYADEKLLEAAMRDRSMEQLVNMATLPGIVGYALAMPDIHQGYGFVIGGVAATRLPSGVISPGGVGYDINCLSGDSQILHEHGYTMPIAEMVAKASSARLRCQDFGAGQEDSTDIALYLRRRPDTPVYRLRTEAGDEITATADHPFWTPQGMVELGHLSPGDRVAVYPFVGVPYEPPPTNIILDEGDIERMLRRFQKDERGNSLSQIIAHLRRRGLLPLCYNSPQLPYLLKLLGYALGDGTLYFTGGRGKGVTWFYGKPEDLEDIRRDVMALGFTPSPVYTRRRQHHITTQYDDYTFNYEEAAFKVSSSAFTVLLAALGAPVGRKAEQDFRVPVWLMAAPCWQKRLFLAAFFGAELTAPRPYAEHGYNFPAPVLSLNKRGGYVESGEAFLTDLAEMLAEFGVNTAKISQRQEQTNPDGTVSYRLRLILSTTPESLINLWAKVGFEYNRERRCLANAAVQYLKLKQGIVAHRQEVAEKAVAMQQAGLPRGEIFQALTDEHINQRFIERSLYEGRATVPRISSAFPVFEEYRQEATRGLEQSGMVWARIASIELVEDFSGEVYDFTVTHPDHNFIANGFVVSNCGVRLLVSSIEAEEVQPYLSDLASALYSHVPSGVGKKGVLRLSAKELDEVLVRGAAWAVEHGYGTRHDLEHLEEQGSMPGASAKAVSQRAKERGRPQLGTLGSGNHFLEVQEVVEIYDPEVAEVFGLFEGQLAVQVHSGSRGLGHQVCSDYVRILQSAVHKYGIKLPDRELVCAPLDSPEGRDYLAAMIAAANYAWANRQCLTHLVREAFEVVLAGKVRDWSLRTVYDVAHNIAKIEEHVVDGKRVRVCVHRKGATRAFPPGSSEIPADYREVGQPVLVPGDMGTASYVLVGTEEAMRATFGSTCHGAGRVLSRRAAKKRIRGSKLRDELEAQGIHVRAGSMAGLAEEAPAAYKDIERVVEVVHRAGIARKVAKLRPLAVIKG